MPDVNAAYFGAHRRRERTCLDMPIVRGTIVEFAGWMKSHPITCIGKGLSRRADYQDVPRALAHKRTWSYPPVSTKVTYVLDLSVLPNQVAAQVVAGALAPLA